MDVVLESAFRDPVQYQFYHTVPPWIMPAAVLFGLVVDPTAGWFASMIPTYYWRRHGGAAIKTLRELWT